MKKIAIYPGSFDPVTLGHTNIIERGAKVFDELTVAVANKPPGQATFTVKERVAMARKAVGETVAGGGNVTVEAFDGLLMEYASKKGAAVIIRGMRSVSDFEYELQMATANKALNPAVETVFMVTEARFSHISSSLIKEVVSLGGSADGMLPEFVEKKLRSRLRSSRSRGGKR